MMIADTNSNCLNLNKDLSNILIYIASGTPILTASGTSRLLEILI